VSEVEEIEEIDAVPVLAPEALARERSRALVRSVAPTVQAAAVAAGGFVAGAAVVGLAHRHRGRPDRSRRRGARGRRRSAAGGERLQIVGSRSLLLDVHLLGNAGRGR
jgi:hypothetical protein